MLAVGKGVKALGKGLLGRFGYELRPKRPSSWTSIHSLPEVRTLIDVGIGYGTVGLYEAFPSAYLVLIDPLSECQPVAQAALASREGEWIQSALGARPGELDLSVEVGDISKSSFLPRTALTRTKNEIEKRSVPVRVLDDIVAEHGFEAPLGVKIDTEGFELECLKGASDTLKKASFVIVECSVRKRFEGSYEIHELVARMLQSDLKLHSVLSADADRNGVVRYLDLAFTRQNPDA